MSDKRATSSGQTAPALSPAEAFESLIFLSHRWMHLVGASSTMTAQGLSVPAFIVLATASAEPGSALGKLARNAGLDKAAAAEAMRSLRAAGLVEQARVEGKKGFTVTVTAKGQEVLAALRAGFATAAGEVPEANWRAVPRLAAILRRLGRVLAPKAGAAA